MANLVEIDVQAKDNATKTVDDVRASLRSLSDESAIPAIDLRGSEEAESDIKVVGDAISSLGRQSAVPEVDLRGSDEAVTEAHEVSDAVSSLGRQTATPDVELKGATEAAAEAAAASDAIKELGKSSTSASSEAGGLGSTLGGLSSAAMPALIGAGVALSPVIATVGFGLGGLGVAAEQTISPIIAASQATGGLQANMSSLTPVQQGMAQQLIGLQGEVGKFTASLQPEVVSLWGSGLKLAGGILGDIQPVAKATGDALNGVVNDISADLKTSEWQNFFGFMAQQAGPDLQMVGKLFTDLINDLPPLLEDLQPVANGFLQVADGTAKAVSALEQMPSKINQVSDSNDSLLSKASGWLNTLSSKIPDGNRSILSLASSWLGLGNNAQDSVDKQQKAAQAAQAAVTPVNQLATAVSTAATNTTALDTAWNILVGNFNGEQAAIVAAKTAVQSYGDAVKQSGAGSLAAQSQFFAAVQSVQQMTDAEVKNHAPAAQLYKDIQDQITGLKSKGPLNAAEKQDLDNLKTAADAVASSTAGLTKQEQGAATAIEKNLLPQVQALHTNGTTLNTDMKNLANSILNTGTQSTASASARNQMIADLEKAGVDAKTAKSDVDNFQTGINGLHGKVVTVGVDGTEATREVQNVQNAINGLYGKTVQIETITNNLIHTTTTTSVGKAAGGIVGAAGGGPRSDLVMVGEQGPELVRLPGGSTVHSNPDSQRMLAGSGGFGQAFTFEIAPGGASAFEQFMVTAIKEWVRIKGGGNVQAAFGRS